MGILTSLAGMAASLGAAAAEAASTVGTAVASTAASAASAVGSAASTVGSAVAGMSATQVGALASGVAGAVGGTATGIMGYQQGKAQKKAMDEAAQAAIDEAKAEGAQLDRQAGVEDARAGIEQVRGEREAERRSRVLAHDVGQMYADFAGNGLLVDGGTAKDTVGSALRLQASEAAADVGTIRDNAAMQVWGHMANAAQLRTSAANARIRGRNQARLYRWQGRQAARQGRVGLGLGLGQGLFSLGAGLLGSGLLDGMFAAPATNAPFIQQPTHASMFTDSLGHMLPTTV